MRSGWLSGLCLPRLRCTFREKTFTINDWYAWKSCRKNAPSYNNIPCSQVSRVSHSSSPPLQLQPTHALIRAQTQLKIAKSKSSIFAITSSPHGKSKLLCSGGETVENWLHAPSPNPSGRVAKPEWKGHPLRGLNCDKRRTSHHHQASSQSGVICHNFGIAPFITQWVTWLVHPSISAMKRYVVRKKRQRVDWWADVNKLFFVFYFCCCCVVTITFLIAALGLNHKLCFVSFCTCGMGYSLLYCLKPLFLLLLLFCSACCNVP